MSTIDAHRPHRLRGEHAHLVRGVLEVAELAHEPLRVQRPAFAVPRHESEQPLEARQRVGEVLHLRDLQVMAGHRFVVAGAHFLPQREARRRPCVGYHVRPGREKSSLGPV